MGEHSNTPSVIQMWDSRKVQFLNQWQQKGSISQPAVDGKEASHEFWSVQRKTYIWGTESSRVPFSMHESQCSHLSLFIFTKQVNTIGLIEKRWFVIFKKQKCKFSRGTRLDPKVYDDKNMACVRFPGRSHHVDDIVHLIVCCSARRPFHLCFHTVSCMKRFIPPLLSVHARFC